MYSLSKLQKDDLSIGKLQQKLIHEIAESKGRQQFYSAQNPEILRGLLDSAMIESIRASTAIEGVIVPKQSRLSEMIRTSSWNPKNRDEEDVLAYKNALSFVYRNKKKLSAELILEISNILWAHDKDKAGFKKQDNKIVLRYPDGKQVVRFEPAPAKKTPKLVEQSCEIYHKLISEKQQIDHQVVSAFILDLLCIHPLEDGNGRLARLLHTLLLLENGYTVVKYIALEGLIEKDKINYYDTLHKSSISWELGKNNLNPWMNFCIGKLNLALKRFERQINEAQKTFTSPLGKPKLQSVERALETLNIGQKFNRDFIVAITGISSRTVRRALEKWTAEGRILKIGIGRNTEYQKIK